jgi:hypothetical protein
MIRRMLATLGAFAAITVSAMAESPWWNPAWDPAGRVVWAKKPEASDLKADPSRGRDIAVVRNFVLANAPETDAVSDFWAWYGLVENCADGMRVVDDLSTEFGDRARGRAALVDARNRLRSWASTKGNVLSLYFPAILGPYDQQSQSFAPSRIADPTTDPSRIKFGPTITPLFNVGATIAMGPMLAPTKITGQSNVAMCPDAKFGFKSYPASWSIELKPTGPARGGFEPAIDFPPIRMSPSAAQAYVAKHPQRAIVYEVQLRLSPQRGSLDGTLHLFIKGVDVVRTIARDDTGAVLETVG